MIGRLSAAAGRDVSRETYEMLHIFEGLLRREAEAQNLVSAATLDSLWDRHILDSAQLARFDRSDSQWVDIGSGAGLPGIVLAAIIQRSIVLIEPRRLRAEFLERAAAAVGVEVEVFQCKSERVERRFDIITARAVAPLGRLLAMTHHLSHAGTKWVLPKGKNAKSELAEARGNWHYDVSAEPSVTDPDARILLLTNVRAKSVK